jgi:hypothetical protein
MTGMIDEVIGRMQRLLEPLAAKNDPRQYFHATYLRTTMAVAAEIKRGGFVDAEWTERWDAAFASFYLDALEAAISGGEPSRPWAVAFGAPAERPALNHVLFGMNAHVNFDLPQALLAVITDDEFDEPAVIARREADHRNIDRVLASRVAAEDDVLIGISGPGSRLNRLLKPLNELGSRRCAGREGLGQLCSEPGPQAGAEADGALTQLSASAPPRSLRSPGHRPSATEARRHRLVPPPDVPARDPLPGPDVHNGSHLTDRRLYRKAQA